MRRLSPTVICLPLVALVGLAWAAPGPPAPPHAGGEAGSPADLTFFEAQVRPLLAQRCYGCHSSRAAKVQGGLTLDTREGWARGGTSGPAIVPGDPDKSLLLQAVRYAGAVKMPPAGKLPEREIATLTEWIKRGAPWPASLAPPAPPNSGGTGGAKLPVMGGPGASKRWAYQKPVAVAPPAVKLAGWCRTPVDRFILAKLESKGLRPNPAADRRTLIRRASFDLIGLPPTAEEVEAFVADRSPDAWAKVVDRLLASPHYGERWGRHWLDLARFAESHGFEHDYDRPSAYQYRDFVIRALNADMPYDQFVKWQLAGDELAPDDPLALTATGFLAAGVHSTQITKNQAEKERYDELDDMLATTGTSMLGLTIGCARCHDHKYDPIPTKDYYRLLSTFTTTVRSEVDVNLDPKGYQTAKAAFDREHAPLAEALRTYEAEQLPGRLVAWLKDDGRRLAPAQWCVLHPDSAKSLGGATFSELPDGSLLAGGPSAERDTYTFVARTSLAGITAIRLEALADPSLVKGGPGRAANGNFALSNISVRAEALDGQGLPVEVKLARARATFEQKGLPVAAAIDGDGTTSWAVDPEFGKDHAAVFETEAPVGFSGGTRLTITLRFNNNTAHSIGRPRLSVTAAPGTVPLDGVARPEAVEQALASAAAGGAPADADQKALLAWYRTQDPEWVRLNARVQEHLAQAPKPKLEKALISTEGLPAVRLHTQGDDFLPVTHFLRRGDPSQKVEVAQPGFLTVLTRAPEGEKHWQTPPPAGWRTSYRRRALAEWIADPEQGAGYLLARVIVNRLWQHHFGRGIVATPSDFGAQGQPPTHPELLDYLARELVSGGAPPSPPKLGGGGGGRPWSLKRIHRLLMLSAVYTQSSAVVPAKAKADPENRLCGRYARWRLEAEAIRDAMLTVSGTLDPTMFGPGTLDEAQKRRSIYFTVKRSRLIPILQVFDAPDALLGLGVRSTTTVAPQALLLLNNPQVRGYAHAFAARVAPKPETAREQAVRAAYLTALSRQPSVKELADSLAFLTEQTASYRTAGHADADALALADLCQALMGLNEFIYVN
jgi:hypothetical protein